jgi:hypothetical protein
MPFPLKSSGNLKPCTGIPQSTAFAVWLNVHLAEMALFQAELVVGVDHSVLNCSFNQCYSKCLATTMTMGCLENQWNGMVE